MSNVYVIYSTEEEMLISALEQEHQLIDEYFTKGGRTLDDYDRNESSEPICIRPRLQY